MGYEVTWDRLELPFRDPFRIARNMDADAAHTVVTHVTDDGDRSEGLRQAQGDEAIAHAPQAMRLELKADDEEQEHDTELGERVDRFGLLDELESPRADRDAGEKVARDRAEPEAVRRHHRDHRGCEIDRDLQQ